MQGPTDGRSLKPPRKAVPVESWRPVALLVATGVVAAFQIGKIPLSLNYLQSDFGFDLVMAGWVASLFAVMGAVCAVLLSFTLSVFGLKPMLLSGLMISMCASLLGGMTPDVSWLLVTRAFEGLGFILCVLCLPPLIGQLAPKGQASAAMAYWAMYLPLGTCVMLLISAVILPIFSWRVVWVVSAIALLGMAWLIARLDVQQKDSASKQSLCAADGSPWLALSDRSGELFCSIYGAILCFCEFSTKDFSRVVNGQHVSNCGNHGDFHCAECRGEFFLWYFAPRRCRLLGVDLYRICGIGAFGSSCVGGGCAYRAATCGVSSVVLCFRLRAQLPFCGYSTAIGRAICANIYQRWIGTGLSNWAIDRRAACGLCRCAFRKLVGCGTPYLGCCWIDIFGRHGFAYIIQRHAGSVSFVGGALGMVFA